MGCDGLLENQFRPFTLLKGSGGSAPFDAKAWHGLQACGDLVVLVSSAAEGLPSDGTNSSTHCCYACLPESYS